MKMIDSLHATLCVMAGPDLLDWSGAPIHLVGEGKLLPAVGNAIYVVTDDEGEVVYVGSVARRSTVKHRLREHLRDSRKKSAWRNVWVVSLKAETSRERVRFLEGRFGKRLGYRGRLPTYSKVVA